MNQDAQRAYELEQAEMLDRALAHAQELFASKKVKLGVEEATQIIEAKPSSVPTFPFMMFSLGLLKDALDFLDLTLVGTLFAFLFSVIFGFIFFFWSMGKISGGWWKKGLISWLWKRIVIVALIEFIPFVQMVPATALLILLAHYHETKLAKLINLALEQIHGARSPQSRRTRFMQNQRALMQTADEY